MAHLHDYEIEEILLESLLSDEKLTALIDDKIFPVYIEENTEGDAVYYDSEMTEPDLTKMGVAKSSMRFFVCAVSDRMDHANKIIGTIQDILEGEYANPYMRIVAVGTAKDGVNTKFAKTIEFTVDW